MFHHVFTSNFQLWSHCLQSVLCLVRLFNDDRIIIIYLEIKMWATSENKVADILYEIQEIFLSNVLIRCIYVQALACQNTRCVILLLSVVHSEKMPRHNFTCTINVSRTHFVWMIVSIKNFEFKLYFTAFQSFLISQSSPIRQTYTTSSAKIDKKKNNFLH